MTNITQALGDWVIPSLWAMNHKYVDNRKFRFYSKKRPISHRPWQAAPLDDPHQRIVIKKARQQGFTEIMACIKMIHFATLTDSVSVYTLPKAQKANELARDRIDVLGKANNSRRLSAEMRERLVGWRATTHKYIKPLTGGRSSIIITGSWNEDLGESTAADQALFDEFDRMRPGVISAFKKSLDSSIYKLQRVFSTPTFPNYGVAGLYEMSDKKRWFFKCTKCGHWQSLDRSNILQIAGPTSLVSRLESHDKYAQIPDGTFIIGCVKCLKPLDRLNAKGQWVAENKLLMEWSGYATSQLDCCWFSGDDIMRDLRDLEPGLAPWYNYTLGLEYLGDSGGVEKGWIYTLVDHELGHWSNRETLSRYITIKNMSIGIDWGKRNWLCVLVECEEYSVPLIAHIESFVDTSDPLDTVKWAVESIRKWKPDVVIADNGYGQDRNPRVAKAIDKLFFGCTYPAHRHNRKPVTIAPKFGAVPAPANMPHPVVEIDRTSSLKARMLAIKKAEYVIAPFDVDTLDELDKHLRGVVISVDKNDKGEMVEDAITTGDDHYLHTLNYAEIGMEWIHTHKAQTGVLSIGELYSESDVNEGLPTFADIVNLQDWGIGVD